MWHEGDLFSARKEYLEAKNKNLVYLLEARFLWMQTYLKDRERGLELGAGIGASKLILKDTNLELSDVVDSPWLDHRNVDALDTKFPSESYDYVIASNMLHHVAKPNKFFSEVARVMKPGGLLLLNEANTSLMSKVILILMRHEGFNDDAKVFDPNYICNDPDDPWSANCSIPRLLFDDKIEFHANFPDWEILHDSKHEFLTFINSGGVTAKFFYVPLNQGLFKITSRIDEVLALFFPNIFALGRRVVLRKKMETQ